MSVQVITETLHEDGSGWMAAVQVAGVVYRASFVAGRLSVSLGPYKHNPRRPRWALGVVRSWAESRVALLSPEWLALHSSLYSA